MESVTHAVMVFKAEALKADGKSGEELSLCRYRTRRQWRHDGKRKGCVGLCCAWQSQVPWRPGEFLAIRWQLASSGAASSYGPRGPVHREHRPH